MAGVNVTVTGLKQTLNAFKQTVDATDDIIRQTMQAALLLLEADMRKNAPRDTGQLANSVTHNIGGSGLTTIGEVGPTVAYWPFVERGTKPHWPPVAAVTPWARRHGIPPFLVARSIAKKGTKAQPFVRPAWEHNQQQIRDMFDAIGLQISMKFRKTF